MTKHLLFVEDNVNLSKTLLRLFRIRLPDVMVTHAVTAGAAITIARGIRFHAVLSDFNLADGSLGSEVLAYFKAEQPALVERFVYLSDDPRCKSHKHWVEKPAANQDLVAKLREVLA